MIITDIEDLKDIGVANDWEDCQILSFKPG